MRILPWSVVVLAVLAGCAARGPSTRSSPAVSRTEPAVLPPRSVPSSEAALPPSTTASPSPPITPPPATVAPSQARDAAGRARPDSSDDGRPRAQAPTDVARSTQAGRGGLVALDFQRADITAVILTVSEIVGFNYVLAPDVQGTVTVRTIGQISRSDLFDVFRAILDVNGFTAVQAGDVDKIVRREGVRARASATAV